MIRNVNGLNGRGCSVIRRTPPLAFMCNVRWRRGVRDFAISRTSDRCCVGLPTEQYDPVVRVGRTQRTLKLVSQYRNDRRRQDCRIGLRRPCVPRTREAKFARAAFGGRVSRPVRLGAPCRLRRPGCRVLKNCGPTNGGRFERYELSQNAESTDFGIRGANFVLEHKKTSGDEAAIASGDAAFVAASAAATNRWRRRGRVSTIPHLHCIVSSPTSFAQRGRRRFR